MIGAKHQQRKQKWQIGLALLVFLLVGVGCIVIANDDDEEEHHRRRRHHRYTPPSHSTPTTPVLPGVRRR